MKYFISFLLVFVCMSCTSSKDTGCLIKKVISFEQKSEQTFSMKVKFKVCNASQEERFALIRKEFEARHPSPDNEIIIEEWMGKMHNQKLYRITLK